MKTILIALALLAAGLLTSACTPNPAAAAMEAQQAKQQMEKIKKDLDQANQLYDKKLNDTINSAIAGDTTSDTEK